MKRTLLLILLLGLTSTLSAQSSPHYTQIQGTPFALVDRYGAKGDGTTDDSAAFLLAAKAGKGRIELSPGKTYKAFLKASGAAAEGTLYFNSTDKHFYGYNGTEWVRLDN